MAQGEQKVTAQSAKGAPFTKLSAKDQDATLTDMEKKVANGFTPNPSTFFNLVRTHAIQGTFCDPYYGGNANFVGWDLIGYPGIRLVVTEDEQRMNVPQSQSASRPNDSSGFGRFLAGYTIDTQESSGAILTDDSDQGPRFTCFRAAYGGCI
jgi:hypothetical protein